MQQGLAILASQPRGDDAHAAPGGRLRDAERLGQGGAHHPQLHRLREPRRLAQARTEAPRCACSSSASTSGRRTSASTIWLPSWCARGHEVTVLTGQPELPRRPRLRRSSVATPRTSPPTRARAIVRVPIAPRGTWQLRLLLELPELRRLAARCWVRGGCAAEPFDAIFVFQMSPITSALPAIAAAAGSSGRRCAVGAGPVAGHAVRQSASCGRARVLGWVGRLVAFIYRRCDLVLAQSRGFVPNIEQVWSGDAARIRYFPAWAEAVFRGAADEPSRRPNCRLIADSFNVHVRRQHRRGAGLSRHPRRRRSACADEPTSAG